MGCVALLYVPSIREELRNAIVAPLGVIGQRLGSGWMMMPRCGRLGGFCKGKAGRLKRAKAKRSEGTKSAGRKEQAHVDQAEREV